MNRVGDTYFDQLERSGHRRRIRTDLEKFADLNIRALRTAIHWERADLPEAWDGWDFQLREMKRLNLRPILGLLHHGSGPHDTSLLDPEFPEKLAAFALEVATRYPDVVDYTPVNEPQTTGRFSCLYGYWYPHHRDMRSYVRALFLQIKGIVLAMRAIRTVRPDARLIHTEDGGATFSTPELEAFCRERERRRWLGADLLCGLVTRDHPLYEFLVRHGLSETEILWFSENACPPSILGINYYVTSDRFLDHRLELYPGRAGGDTGDEPLVDVEAVRVRPEGISGVGAVLRSAWERYRLPLAITEAHLGCEEREQARWLAEVWQQAEDAERDGVDVRAVTAWALLGSYDWCHLCARDTGTYEPGVFDARTGIATPTLLTSLAHDLGHGIPVRGDARQRGWWHSPNRLTVPPPEPVPAPLIEEQLSLT